MISIIKIERSRNYKVLKITVMSSSQLVQEFSRDVALRNRGFPHISFIRVPSSAVQMTRCTSGGFPRSGKSVEILGRRLDTVPQKEMSSRRSRYVQLRTGARYRFRRLLTFEFTTEGEEDGIRVA